MRTTLLPLAALLISTTANAQLNAGEVPAGMTALDLNIDIALTTNFTADSAALELDCDDSFDAWAQLFRGMPAVDAPNSAMLHFIDTDIEVCADMAPDYLKRPKYYAFGEPLDCAGNFEWQNVPQLSLGDLGTFTAIGPAVIDSMYIAYRRGTTMGWIELSFDVNDDAEINLQVHSVLPLCPVIMSVEEGALPATVNLFPNPSNGEAINLQSAGALRSIDVMDATGRTIAHYNGTVRTIAAPKVAGTYLVRFLHSDGQRSTTG
ncbi:MAG: T9SS type A sorting domain-containing protein [Flavobacteriales bacterium]|nr:T9SS type A sorting domain-containing protein [Flavobacteriales bacterium]